MFKDNETATRLYLANGSPYSAFAHLDSLQSEIQRDLTVDVHDMAYVVPPRTIPGFHRRSGVFDRDLQLVAEDTVFNGGGDTDADWKAVSDAFVRLNLDSIPYIDEDVIFLGRFSGHFGHVMLDNMTRLWYPLTHSSDSRRLVAVSPARRDFQDIFLELAGIDANRILWVEQPTRFRSVTVPEQASHSWAESDCFHREAQLVPFERIRTSAIERSVQRAFKRIYLSRSALSGRRVLVGEGYFEEFYALHGYEVVFPEQLPLTEQIALIGRADEIVCTMGTLAHFGLFAKPGARLTILLVHSHKVLKPQAWINRMKSLDWRIVDVDQSCLPVIPSAPTVLDGPSLIGPTNAFHDYVHDCFSEEIRVRVSEELPAYVEAWLEYCLAEYWQIQSFTVFDILNGFSLAIHKKALDEKWLELATLRKLESDLEKKLAEKGALRNRTIAGRSKNVLPYPYPRRGPYHRDGIDWVDLGDGRIDAYGTAECDTTYELTLPLVKTSFMTHGRRYVFFIGVDGASIDTYYLSGAVANRDGTPGVLLRNLDTGTGRAGFSSMFIGDTRGFEYFGRLYIVVKEGVRLDHVVFQPMICRVEDYDGMWEPYRHELRDSLED